MKYSDDTEGLQGARKIPVYQSAVRLGQAVNEFALKIYEAKQGKPEIDCLHRKANLIAAKIASGHCLGYNREFMAENIRLCREAKEASCDCEKVLSLLLEQEFETAIVLSLQELTREIIKEITGWIKSLESRVY
jgi:hypothetical protein